MDAEFEHNRSGGIFLCDNISRGRETGGDSGQIQTRLRAGFEDELHGMACRAAAELSNNADAISSGK